MERQRRHRLPAAICGLWLALAAGPTPGDGAGAAPEPPAAAGAPAAVLRRGRPSALPERARADFEAAVVARGLDPAAVVRPDRATEEMARWAQDSVPSGPPPADRLGLLLDAILSPSGLGLTYEGSPTRTAEEVFRDRAANCLGFSFLVVALARELGLDAYYVEVEEIQRYSKVEDLILVSDHVTVGFGAGAAVRVLEFAAAEVADYRRLVRISPIGGVALYYSNRGAELLRARRPAEALGPLETAVTLDPRLARAWLNLGVARRRLGDLDRAEAAYREATRVEADCLPAYFNLAGLLRLRGHADAAGEILRLLSRQDNRNPYIFLTLGDFALEEGRLDEARRYYRRAVRHAPEEVEPMAALGLWAARSGEDEQARRWLGRAAAIDAGNPRVRRLAAALGEAGPPAADGAAETAAPARPPT